MRVVYIKETDKTCDIVKVIVIKIRKILNIIKMQEDKKKIIYYIPVFNDTKISKLRTKKIVKKIIKLLEKEETYNVALSECLENNELFKNYLYSGNINILDGRFLFKCLINKILKYLFEITDKEMKRGEVSLLINDFTDINKEIIIDIAKNIKRLNIVTNHMERCKKLEQYLYNEFGIILNVLNNKNKSLSESEIIINIDFAEETVNKYRIYDKAIIVNINDNISLKSKRFNGINANYYKIKIMDRNIIEGFRDEVIYESMLYGNTYKFINEKITKDKIEINKLIGNNGIITRNEIKNVEDGLC